MRTFVLLALLLCGSVTAQGGAQLLARWTIYHVHGMGPTAWSAWYAQGPYPVRVRFKCSSDSIIVDVQNTDRLTQGVTVRHWDVEPDEAALTKAISSRKALQNGGFELPVGQSTLQPVLRPALCKDAPNSFVFGALYSL